MIIVSNSLSELSTYSRIASRIVLISSSGFQSRLFAYNALGLGNLIAQTAFAFAIKGPLTKVDIFPLIQLAKPSMSQPFATLYSRSLFKLAIPSPKSTSLCYQKIPDASSFSQRPSCLIPQY